MIFLEDPTSFSNKTFHKNHDNSGYFLINPRVVYRSKEEDMKVWTEECLVLPPTFRATLLRDAIVTVEYQSFDGQYHQVTLEKELSRAFQHEMDHNRGVLIVDHVGLDEMDPFMRKIETSDHAKKMEIAYDRFISDPFLPLFHNSHENSMKKSTVHWDTRVMLPPANASDEERIEKDNPKNENLGYDCDEECIQSRNRIIQDRRAMMKQSRSSTKRSDVLELSQQRAALYDTDYKGFKPNKNTQK